jgi:acetylornithine deacetylase
MDSTIKFLADLVAIDSVNPSLVPGGAGEQRIARAIAAEMRASGLEVEVTNVAPGRPNVVGVLEGRAAGRTLMLCGHMDTVGVAGMPSPFDPLIRSGCLYGRGALDMKGGVAAMIGAARVLVQEGGLDSGRLIVAAVADEECASLGAEALVRRWRADGAVVTEPTGLGIAAGHKGFSWIEITTAGRAAHGSRPSEGRDAIFHMGRVLAGLEALDRRLQSPPPHPLLGTASLHASLIDGGRELSTYPGHCTLKMERRTLCGEPTNIALSEVEAILTRLAEDDPQFEANARFIFGRPPYEIAADHELLTCLERTVDRLNLERATSRTAATFWCDAAILGQAGIPTVIFGPGGDGMHSLEEYVRVDDVLACRDALVELARLYCV